MAKEFEEGFGSPARGWQLDVAETTYLDLDCVHKAFILSPLKVLQADQVRSFKEMGIEAAAVNGDTWSLEKACQIQAIFASLEMCLQHPKFRAFLSDASLSEEITIVVVDEAHCISQ
ncbi:hypothetical protein FA13DRAFT_1806049 [Coprinellus micaceus]|uniref:DEAD/DEAH-box helicase domain-containing protein n=1 Tax=Coprinellus micaceus TaxID=71717 RepID=A0A4Y7RSL3_COPMI|nr:hypothetical protein FA13DRAFT_1806049 [Coprinellus micaceus]